MPGICQSTSAQTVSVSPVRSPDKDRMDDVGVSPTVTLTWHASKYKNVHRDAYT